jgi:hypothetical protein
LKNRLSYFIPLALGIITYWATAYPTITWWDASEYSTAAVSFGLTGPPGSIIMTSLGWTLSHCVNHNPAFLLNLFAGVIGSLTVVVSFLVFLKITRLANSISKIEFTVFESIALIATSLIIICSTTLWEYSIMFTPYTLTVLFTMFILYSVLNWWENADNIDSWKKVLVITLLLGIDFSVHRTNAVLIPGIILMMLIRNYRFLLSYKSYLAAFAGIIIGLSIQLLYIPMSLRDPSFNLGEINNLQQLWNFVSMKQYGGNFIMDIVVRKGPLWTYQIPYYFKGFAYNFLYLHHTSLILGYLPTLLGVMGIVYFFKKDKRVAIALTMFLLVTIITSIIYFNLPENYFRTIYRHYLPTYIIFSVFIFAGSYYLFQLVLKLSKSITLTVLILFIGIAFTQFETNLKIRNSSKNTITYDHSKNILLSVETNGILFGDGDSNYFPELYIQIGDHYRPDITQCNLSLSNLDWYLKQLQRHDKHFPFKGEGIDLTKIFYYKWKAKIISIPLDIRAKKEYSTQADTCHLSLLAFRPDNILFIQDLVLFDVFKNNQWNRPVYFIKSGLSSELYNWLKPNLSDEGLVYKFVPDSTKRINIAVIEKNLKNFKITGYNDPDVYLDDNSSWAGNLYYEMFLNIIKSKIAKGEFVNATKYFEQMEKALPIDRLKPDKTVQNEIKNIGNSLKIMELK